MIKKTMVVLFALTLTACAKIDMDKLKDKIVLDGQEVFIEKAEIIVNAMPGPGKGKNEKYIVIKIKAKDGKKIKAKYEVLRLSFPEDPKKFAVKVTEKRGDTYIVRNLPESAGKGTLTVLELKDSKGNIHYLKAEASLQKVF